MGERLKCGPGLVLFGCEIGLPVELEIYHSDAAGAKPAVYNLVRVR